MTKFKIIATPAAAAAGPGRSGGPGPTRRRVIGGLAALGLAAPLLPAARAGSAQPVGLPPGGGVLAEAFTWVESPRPAPATPIATATGEETSLADFQGRVVLLNFWATWCAPCIREMPSLDRLQAELKGEGLDVVAVSQDFGGMDLVGPFFERLKLDNLAIYLDSKGALAKAFGIAGLPTTLLIDRQGLVVGGMEGPAEWDSDEAVAIMRHYLEQPEPA